MKYKLLLVAMLATVLAACTGGGFNYKGVQVTVHQETDVKATKGSSAHANVTSDADEVPEHQQGSDVAVPLLKELGKAYKRKLDVTEKLIKECLDNDKSIAECKGLDVPDIPDMPTDPTNPPVDPPVDPTDPPVTDIPEVNASWGNGNLWKPVSDSRGGVPVVLTNAAFPRCDNLRLYSAAGEIPLNVEAVGRTNPDRETYFLMNQRASEMPKGLVLEVCEQIFFVPDPTQRYESPVPEPEGLPISHYNTHSWDGCGTSIILCKGDEGESVSIGDVALRLHGPDKDREVWTNGNCSTGGTPNMLGTATVKLKTGDTYRFEIDKRDGITHGDCFPS